MDKASLWSCGRGSLALLITATAMCSSGLKTLNLKYKTNDDSRTNVKKRTEPAIAYSRC